MKRSPVFRRNAVGGLVAGACGLLPTSVAQAQGNHADHGPPGSAPTAPTPASGPAMEDMPAMQMTERPGTPIPAGMDMQMPGMQMTGPLGIPMAREGSGTSWQPDSSPMAAIHAQLGDWQLMVHGVVFVGFDAQASARGDRRFTSINWLMAMARHPLGPGELSARVMMSAEPLTIGGFGYPILLQTGETWNGQSLHDRQHPHDLFMETALLYLTPIGGGLGLQLYAAPAGEPALGPVAFPHRISARTNPFAPIGHHWQDSTHISYGVATVGLFGRSWKMEGSWFNGREPDENRYGFDLRVPDSFSGRLIVNPTDDLSMQASYGYLKSPEASEPEESLQRASASITHNARVFGEGNWASTAALGVNVQRDRPVTTMALVETNLDATPHHTVFARIEGGTKTGADLVLPFDRAQARFAMAAFSLGYAFRFPPVVHIVPALGAVGDLNVVGAELGRVYETRTPAGGMVFLQLRPEDMSMHAGHGASMPGMQM